MKSITTKKDKQEYQIIPIYSTDGKKIEDVIESAFLKYLKYNDYK